MHSDMFVTLRLNDTAVVTDPSGTFGINVKGNYYHFAKTEAGHYETSVHPSDVRWIQDKLDVSVIPADTETKRVAVKVPRRPADVDAPPAKPEPKARPAKDNPAPADVDAPPADEQE